MQSVFPDLPMHTMSCSLRIWAVVTAMATCYKEDCLSTVAHSMLASAVLVKAASFSQMDMPLMWIFRVRSPY